MVATLFFIIFASNVGCSFILIITMNKEELKNVILGNVNLSPSRKAELELFFSERDDISVENCMLLFNEWNESKNGETANALVDQFVLAAKEAQIQHSLYSISYHDYTKIGFEYNLWCGVFYIVRDKSTSLYGLISADGGEVIPCICDTMSVSSDGFIDISFKQRKYSFMLLSSARNRRNVINFSYGKDGLYCLEPNKMVKAKKKDGTECELKVLDLNEITLNLIDLLNINHRWNSKEDQ